MILLVCLLAGLVTAEVSYVVHQPNGIVSIITELEPEQTPVTFPQAVDRVHGRRAATEDSLPLAEGEVRVRSNKIRVVDPKTGFVVVHDSNDPSVKEDKHPEVSRNGERRSGIQLEPALDVRLAYPFVDPEALSGYRIEKKPQKIFQRRRNNGQYGLQYPKRNNTVRTETTTRVRNNDGPAKVYKHTVVRPVTEEDEFRTAKKHGKHGRYGTVVFPGPTARGIPNVGKVIGDRNSESEISSGNEPHRRKTEKEYSSRTLVRFPDGYAQGNEKRVESSSKYKTGTSTRNDYEDPSVTISSNSDNRKVDRRGISRIRDNSDENKDVDQPLQEETRLISSDSLGGVDGGLVDDSGVTYEDDGYGSYEPVYGGGIEKDKHFVKEKGKDYTSAHSSAHGGKGQKGYKDEESFSKGEHEKRGHDENKGFSLEKEGDKKSHLDKSSQYADGHKASEGVKGSDFNKEKGHKKGHKKSGFRTVHHKDEYKKNEEFYDEEHSSGDSKQEGHKSEQHSDKSGGEDKKEYVDSGHHESSRGHEGGHDHGQGHHQQEGYRKEKGQSGHYGKEAEYGKKAGHKEGEVHGHSGYGGQGHGYH